MKLEHVCTCCLTESANKPWPSLDDVPASSTVSSRQMLAIFVGLERADRRGGGRICGECSQRLASAHAFYRQTLKATSKELGTTTAKDDDDDGDDNKTSKTTKTIYRPIRAKPPINDASSAPEAPPSLRRIFRCRTCYAHFPRKHDLERHRRAAHLPARNPLWYCTPCSTQFHTQLSHVRHQRLHADNVLCMFCNIGFRTAAEMREHTTAQHDDQHCTTATTTARRRFTCYQCASAFRTRRALLRHWRQLHGARRVAFLCGVCLVERFEGRAELRAHLGACVANAADSAAAAVLLAAESRVEVAASVAARRFVGERDDGENGEGGAGGGSAAAAAVDAAFDDMDMPVEFLNYDGVVDDGGECYFDASYMDGMVEEFLDDAFQMQMPDGLDFGLDVDDESPSAPQQEPPPPPSSATTTVTTSASSSSQKHSYSCPRCFTTTGKSFDTQRDLYLHLAHEHNEPVLVCGQCGEAFAAASALDEHRGRHKIENRLANESLTRLLQTRGAEAAAGVENEVRQALQPPPTTATLFCTLCDKTFRTLAGLKYHLLTHTSSAAGARKPFPCVYCAERFLTAGNLSAHLRARHSAVKPAHCDRCPLAFGTAYQLRRHAASVHDGDAARPHRCATCGKAYTQRSHLRHHEWTHSGRKAFACGRCGGAFTTRTSLRKHQVRQGHEEEEEEEEEERAAPEGGVVAE